MTDRANPTDLWRLAANSVLLRFGTVRHRVQIPGPRPSRLGDRRFMWRHFHCRTLDLVPGQEFAMETPDGI